MSLLSGLQGLGLGNLENIDIYEKEKPADKEKQGEVKKETNEKDLLFDKHITCPLCDREFKTKCVRAGKVKLLDVEHDLRPKYKELDALKYDVIVCPNCGYAALSRFFTSLPSVRGKLIKENISSKYKHVENKDDIYTYDTAILYHKLALLNAIVKKANASEIAYIFLKLGWITRGKIESLPDNEDNKEMKNALKTEEVEFLKNAYEGFSKAISKEAFPMCGMDEITIDYLLSALAIDIGQYTEAYRLLARVITSKNANSRIKNKAITLKEMIAEKNK